MALPPPASFDPNRESSPPHLRSAAFPGGAPGWCRSTAAASSSKRLASSCLSSAVPATAASPNPTQGFIASRASAGVVALPTGPDSIGSSAARAPASCP